MGKLANNNYGMRVAYSGSSASGSPNNDDLMFSTESDFLQDFTSSNKTS